MGVLNDKTPACRSCGAESQLDRRGLCIICAYADGKDPLDFIGEITGDPERQRLAQEARKRAESKADSQRLAEEPRSRAQSTRPHPRSWPSAAAPIPPVRTEEPAPGERNGQTDWWFSQLKTAGDEAAPEAIEVKVVGVTFEGRQAVIQRLQTGECVWLRREPENRHEGSAISVVRQNGEQIGHIEHERAAEWSPHLDAYGKPVQAVVTAITGGEYLGWSLGVRIRFTLPVVAPGASPLMPDFDDNWEL